MFNLLVLHIHYVAAVGVAGATGPTSAELCSVVPGLKEEGQFFKRELVANFIQMIFVGPKMHDGMARCFAILTANHPFIVFCL